ncbi:MAG: O-antigen ligase family protein [Parasporobacterium sp.]|nr:O-antigen ligase family protein [Parasporobacterium sp.]
METENRVNIVEKATASVLDSVLGFVIFLVSLAAFYLPFEIRIIPEVARVLPIVRYVCAGILLVSFFFLYGSTLTVFRRNWALWAAAGFTGVLIFSTVMNGGDLESALGTSGLAGLFLVMDIAVFFRVNPKKYLLTAFFFLLAINIANTCTVYEYCIKRGTGMWDVYGISTNWFFSLVGNYNGGIEYILPMAICGSAYAHRYGKWLDIFNYAGMIMSLIMAIKVDSLTQVVVFAALLVFMVIGNVAMLSDGFAKVLKVVFQPVIFVAVDFAILVSVVIINQSNWVARLGIDPDFHNRRHVWNMSMEWIAQKPIWGSGQETITVEASKITGYAHSHCTYLEAAYKTGFVGCVFLLLLLAAAVVAIYRNRHGRLSYILTGQLFLFGLAAVAETYPMVYVMLCLGLIYYIAKNTNETKEAGKRMRKVRPDPGPASGNSRAPGGGVKPGETTVSGNSPVPGNEGKPGNIPASGNIPTPGNSPAPVQSALDIQEEQLEQVGQKVQEVQENQLSEFVSGDDIDQTVHIDETVLMKGGR